MAEGIPESYADLVTVLDALPLLVREKRRSAGLSQRAASREAGMDELAIHRVEKGEGMNVSTARQLLLWLGGDTAAQ